MLATPVPTHAELAEPVLRAGKHCFVEKPLAQSVADAERAVAAARETGRMLMVGHLLEYHPGVSKLKEIAAAGDLGDIHYIYSNRLNLGKLRADENALWSLGAHDVWVILHLAEEEPHEVEARGESYVREGIEDVVFGFLRFPSGLAAHLHLSWLDPHKERRFTVVGSKRMATFDDMDIERKVTVYDKGYDGGRELLRRVHHPLGRHPEPARSTTASRCGSSASTSSSASARTRARARTATPACASCACSRRCRTLDACGESSVPRSEPRRDDAQSARLELGPFAVVGAGVRIGAGVVLGSHVVVHPGTVIADGCIVQDHVILGKAPKLAPHSSAAGADGPPPLELGPGAVVCAAAIVFAGASIGAGAIVGDQAYVRERAVLGERRWSGAGPRSTTTSSSAIACGSRPTVYLTAFSTIEDDVFVGPGVLTTNDSTMARHDDTTRSAARRCGAPAGSAARRARPGRRDRRGGLHRRRRGRHEGRARARRRDRRARRASCARWPTRTCSSAGADAGGRLAVRRRSGRAARGGRTGALRRLSCMSTTLIDSWTQRGRRPPRTAAVGGQRSSRLVAARRRRCRRDRHRRRRPGPARRRHRAVLGRVLRVRQRRRDVAVIGLLVAIACVTVAALLYAPAMMARTDGRTLGRMVTGIRVVRANGEPMTSAPPCSARSWSRRSLFGAHRLDHGRHPQPARHPVAAVGQENRALHDIVVDTRVVLDE